MAVAAFFPNGPKTENAADAYAHFIEMFSDFAKGICAQLISASSRDDGNIDAVGLFFSLAVIKAKSR
jgi:hypothetical protein